MLNWMSSKVKNDFCDTRKNLFDSFPLIKFVTSVDAIPLIDTTSCIVIATPGHFDSGKLFSLVYLCSINVTFKIFFFFLERLDENMS
jgi:hypothetical protein